MVINHQDLLHNLFHVHRKIFYERLCNLSYHFSMIVRDRTYIFERSQGEIIKIRIYIMLLVLTSSCQIFCCIPVHIFHALYSILSSSFFPLFCFFLSNACTCILRHWAIFCVLLLSICSPPCIAGNRTWPYRLPQSQIIIYSLLLGVLLPCENLKNFQQCNGSQHDDPFVMTKHCWKEKNLTPRISTDS